MTELNTCDCCGRDIHIDEECFENNNGGYLCEGCGDDLYIDDYTQYDDYPYIDGEDSWDGGQYEGDQYRKVEMK